MAQDKGMALGWDDEGEVSEDSYEVLPAGDYHFEVVNFKRERFDGSDTMAPCPQAAIQLKCTNGTRSGTVFERIKLNTKMMWQISAFFKACGLIPADTPEGARVSMSLFQQCVGCTGECKVTVRNYKSNGQDREANNIKFLVPKPGSQPPQQQMTYQPPQVVQQPQQVGYAPQQAQAQQMPQQAQQMQPQQQQGSWGW